MIKQNINIIDLPTLYNILKEIEENLPFKVVNFSKLNDFQVFLKAKQSNKNNFFIITTFQNKDYFVNKVKLELKNIFFLYRKDQKSDLDKDYNIFNYPIEINNLIEKINIQLIKDKYNFQSKIKVNNYFIDLNSRIISNHDKSLKLTEREMDIIIFLNDNKTAQKIDILQQKVWDYSSKLETHTVETHIYRLRKKISEKFKDDNFIISTENGYFIE